VFARSWLSQPVAGADPAFRGPLGRAIIDQEISEPDNLADQVRRVLYQLALSGTAPLANTARLFSLRERTLRRRLGAEGTTFQ
jgi:hypothetical protein